MIQDRVEFIKSFVSQTLTDSYYLLCHYTSFLNTTSKTVQFKTNTGEYPTLRSDKTNIMTAD